MTAFEQMRREAIPLLLGVAGGTGSGKTMSALLLARGMAAGHPFAGIDTENGRMAHYADLFPDVRRKQISAPFRPGKYADAIEEAAKFLAAENVPAANRVVVVDSASHEWYGDGGCLDWHDELMGGDQKKNLSAWIEPKKQHKRMVTRLLQLNAHVILCFRAEPKVEAVRKDGRTEIVPKASLTGLDGWIPIAEKNLPYELTASFLLMADRPGFPKPIKLQEQHKTFVPLDRPLDEEVGKQLAQWAAGGNKPAPQQVAAGDSAAKDEAGVLPASEPASSAPRASAAQKKKLDVLVGQLRDGGHVTTEQLWTSMRPEQTDLWPGDWPRDENGVLHWSPLRDALTKDEASALIDRLERYAANLVAA